MKKNFKRSLSVYFLTIILCMMPIMAVNAAQKGDVDNSPVVAGSTANPGDVQIEKSVTPVEGEDGKYHISFTVKGKDAKKQVNVYAAVVFDRSGSMICGTVERNSGWPYYTNETVQTYSNISETHYFSADDPVHYTAEDGTGIYCSLRNGTEAADGLTDGKWISAVNGAKNFSSTLLSNLPGNSYVSLVSFAGEANAATNWSTTAFNGSDFGHPYGSTNLADGIHNAQSKLASVNDPNAVKVMVVISDGEPDPGNQYATEASNAKTAGTIIYAIGYETSSAADAALTQVASEGNYFKADEASVNAALQRMADELSRAYAGTDATVSDGIASEFTYAGSSEFTQDPNNPQEVKCNIENITEEGTTCGFDVTIDPNVETGWYDTNTHASISYKDANGQQKTINVPSSPKVYWEQAKYNYVVNYYRDEITNTDDTEKFLGSSNGGPIKYGTKITENDIVKNLFLPDKGYKYDRTSPSSITISDNESTNVINVLYTRKNDLSYKVEHYYNENNASSISDYVLDMQATITKENQTFGDRVLESQVALVERDGYTKKEIVGTPLTIDDDETKNIICVYYDRRHDIGYTINYHMNSIDEEPFTSESGQGTFEETVTVSADQINANLPDGYKYSASDSKPQVTISANEDENVMDIVYVKRTDLTYCVHYYYDNILDENATETYENQTFGKKVSDYTPKLKDGYRYDSDTAPITIGTGENIIDVYYVKRTDLSYKVRYLEEGTENYLAPEKTVKDQTFESEVTEKAIDINGYELVSEEEQSLTISAKEAENVITFYYKKRTDLEYDVYYIDIETGEDVKDPKHEEGQTFGDIVTETAPNIPGYVLAEGQNLRADIRITSNNHENYAIFLYEKRKDLSYTVKYLEKGTNKKLADEKLVNNQTYLDEITEKAITINGYKLVGKDSQTITIQVEGNEIIFYYEQEPQPEYVEPPKTGINHTENHTSILMLIITFIISLFGIRLETKKN